MIEQDTIRLLRECDAGIKMGVKSIDDVADRVKSESFRKLLIDCKKEHEQNGKQPFKNTAKNRCELIH